MLDGVTCPCCGQPAKNRGVCHATYALARRWVLGGKTTWKELERRGVVLESRQGQHKDSTAIKRRQYLSSQPEAELKMAHRMAALALSEGKR